LTPNIYQLVGNTNFGGWVIQSNTTLTSNTTETLSPDGTNNATKMTSNGSEGLYLPSLGTASLNTKSIFLKGVSGGEQVILQDPHQNIDPLTCTLTTEWQRFHLTQTQTGSFGLWLTNIPSGGIYAYGPQVQVQGLTDFVANTTGSPKFITGATFGPRVPMILVEPSSENLVTYSEDFSDSSWNKADVTVSAAPVAAPDGTMTASHVVSTGSNAHLNALSIGGASTHTQSIWARTVSGAGTCFFNYHGGTPTTVTEQWQRFEVPSNTAHMYAVNFRGTSTLTEIYIWGAQLEAGSVSTSYIPTSGGNAAARTRAADDLVISGSAFSSFYNGAEGTFYLEAIDRDPTSGTHSFLRGQSEHRDFLFKYNGTSIHSFDGSTGVTQSGIAANQLFRAAVSYKSGSRTLSLNGTSPADGSLNTNWSTADRLRIGNGNAVVANMHVKRVIFWPYHKDNL
jgi:hypothetical protein